MFAGLKRSGTELDDRNGLYYDSYIDYDIDQQSCDMELR